MKPSISPPVSGVHPDEQLQIKLEVDTDPPEGVGYEIKYQLLPVPYHVRIFTLPSLFAGKVHAMLCRGWQSRVKGRDFYDYIWYLSKGVPLNLQHLANRMKQSGHLKIDDMLTDAILLERMIERFDKVDFEQARRDVRPFIRNPESIDIWSKEFFVAVTKDKLRST